MTIFQEVASRPFNRRIKQLFNNITSSVLIAGLNIAIVATASPAYAQNYSQPATLVVKNDRGGLLRQRISQLNALRQSKQPIRITGNICYSTCTMYIGLPQTCISPRTTFGFHGPSSYGRVLDPQTFNIASRIISRDYPPALKEWYMSKGRYKINSVYRIKGSQIIQMGVRQC